MGSATQRLPAWVWFLTLVFATWGMTTVNSSITVAAVLQLPIIAQLLWRRGEPPVLVFACGMQWLQASAAIFYTNFYRIPLGEASASSELELASWLSLGAVFVLALGARMAFIRANIREHSAIADDGLRFNINKVFTAYLISFGAGALAAALAFRIPAVTQVLFAFSALKWVFVFMLGHCVLEQRRGYTLLACAVALEFGTGLLSYFAAFKSVFFILLVVALTSPLALHGRRLALTLMTAAMIFCSGIVWTAIKSDYREFLNQGTESQAVLVPVDERLNKLSDLLSGFKWAHFTDGLEAMVLRVSYVNFFAMTIANVPDNVPHEDGALWLGTLKHIVTPRILFPNKPVINDSERTALYTGIQVAGEEEGTSIGIGYIGESYVDFGRVGMFGPIFLLGVFYGLIYRCFTIHSRFKLLGASIATSILVFGAYTIETSNIKIVGGNVMALIIMTVFYLIFRRSLTEWLASRAQRAGV